MTAPDEAVVAEGLTKVFDSKAAVNGLDLRVARGEFFGFLGPNGAGKTTSIKMMTGLLRPTRGRVWVCGYDVQTQPIEVKRRIGVLPEELSLYERLTGREYLAFGARMYGVGAAEADRRTDELLQLMSLWDDQDKLIVEYSQGMRKKVALACALIHEPPVLFLDEPFNGIDTVTSRQIKEMLRARVAAGVTILFSSHVMEVVEKLCTSLAIIHRGRIVFSDTMAHLTAREDFRSLEDVFISAVGAEQLVHAEDSGWLGT